MRGCGLYDAGGSGYGFGTQRPDNLIGFETPYAVFLQQLGHRGGSYPAGSRWRGRKPPEGQNPWRGKIGLEFKELWVVAPELAAKAVGEAGALGGKLIGHARPFAQLYNLGIQRIKRAQAIRISADRVCQYTSVPTVIFGARRRKTIPEAIQLLGIDGKDLKPAIEQAVYDRAVRRLDGGRNVPGLAGCAAEHPVEHLADPLTGVREGLLAEDRAVRGENAGLMGLGAPVNASKDGRLRMRGYGGYLLCE